MPMLYGKDDREEADFLEPIFAEAAENHDLPKYKLADTGLDSQAAYRLVKDELLDEGNSRLNLATFCQTYMEPEAVALMSETLDKNLIDKSEYPRTAELENRCVNMIAELWQVNQSEKFIGTSTIGSSEACMLAGMALKFRWRKEAAENGLDIYQKRPNLVISAGYQVCWEKFCVYWDIELRAVPIDSQHLSLNMETVMDYVDDYTIGIVGIMGITYTGQYDDIKTLDSLVETYNQEHHRTLSIHVDAASGGFYAPFVEKDLVWDFRLKNVVSINASGHKYGLVYPGVGWVLWRDQQYLPEELIFKVSYLGGEIPTMSINFSHSASQVIGQYYNFVRLGFAGYQEIQQHTHDVAIFLSKEISQLADFKIINDGSQLPLVCYNLKADDAREWTLYDLSDRLLMKGWQVPTYPLPKGLDQTVIQRIVVRADFGMNMAHEFIQDFKDAIADLKKAHLVFHEKTEIKKQGFTH